MINQISSLSRVFTCRNYFTFGSNQCACHAGGISLVLSESTSQPCLVFLFQFVTVTLLDQVKKSVTRTMVFVCAKLGLEATGVIGVRKDSTAIQTVLVSQNNSIDDILPGL